MWLAVLCGYTYRTRKEASLLLVRLCSLDEIFVCELWLHREEDISVPLFSGLAGWLLLVLLMMMWVGRGLHGFPSGLL